MKYTDELSEAELNTVAAGYPDRLSIMQSQIEQLDKLLLDPELTEEQRIATQDRINELQAEIDEMSNYRGRV